MDILLLCIPSGSMVPYADGGKGSSQIVVFSILYHAIGKCLPEAFLGILNAITYSFLVDSPTKHIPVFVGPRIL